MKVNNTNSEITSINKTIKHKKEKLPYKSQYTFSTGCDLLDLVVGGGERYGYPAGRIINIVGDKSSGKTFLSLEIIAAAYHKYKTDLDWKYDDCESGFSFNTKKLYNFEIIPTDRIKSKIVEDAYCNIRQYLETRKGKLGIYVTDSLDGLGSLEGDKIANDRYSKFQNKQKGKVLKKDLKEAGSYRLGKPKYLSQEFFPQLTDQFEKSDLLYVVISQVRKNLDPMSFDKFTRAGGSAMDFYCHTVLWLAQVSKIKVKGRAIGVRIKAKTTKSKTARPYRECFITIYFDYGIDNITTNIDYLYDFLTDTGRLVTDPKGVWINSKQNTKSKEMTRDKLIQYVIDNNLENELKEKVEAKWEEIESSISIKRKGKYE